MVKLEMEKWDLSDQWYGRMEESAGPAGDEEVQEDAEVMMRTSVSRKLTGRM